MGKLILIIEDELDLSEALKAALEDSGFHTIHAENGKVGLELAEKHKPDLILLDLTMPVMTGQEMLAELRNKSWGADIKIVILTSTDDSSTIGTSFEHGVHDFIIKSNTDLADMVKIVKDVCSAE